MARDLIVFGEDWGGLPSSTQHLIAHLAKTRKVVWVNSIGLRRPTLSWRDLKRVWYKLTRMADHERAIQTNADFYIVHPRTFAVPRTGLGRWLAAQLLLRQVRPVM